MRDHVLLQAIARVNRPHEDENGKHKPGGFVLDFVGIFENLEKALAFDSKDVQSVIEGLDLLKARFRDMIAKGRSEYLPLVTGKTADKAAELALESFRDEEKRQSFYSFFRELEDLYEILSPDAFLREFMNDYQRLADLYALLRSAYEGTPLVERELARKTARLVQEHTKAGAIHESVEIYEITPQTLERIAKSKKSDTVKVFNLLKSIGHKVSSESTIAPYLLTIGERAEAIVEAFKQRQISTQEALRQLEDLIREINLAEQEQAKRGISGVPFAIYWLLKQQGVYIANAQKVASDMIEVFDKYPHWQSSERQARQIRVKLYQFLERVGVKDIPQLVEKIMSVIRRR